MNLSEEDKEDITDMVIESRDVGKDEDFTTAYLKGYADAEEKYRKRIKELEEENRIFALEGSRIKLKLHIEENYIPKQKVEESYLNMEKEYARKVYDDNYNRNEVKKEEFYKRQVYEELLEDK